MARATVLWAFLLLQRAEGQHATADDNAESESPSLVRPIARAGLLGAVAGSISIDNVTGKITSDLTPEERLAVAAGIVLTRRRPPPPSPSSPPSAPPQPPPPPESPPSAPPQPPVDPSSGESSSGESSSGESTNVLQSSVPQAADEERPSLARPIARLGLLAAVASTISVDNVSGNITSSLTREQGLAVVAGVLATRRRPPPPSPNPPPPSLPPPPTSEESGDMASGDMASGDDAPVDGLQSSATGSDACETTCVGTSTCNELATHVSCDDFATLGCNHCVTNHCCESASPPSPPPSCGNSCGYADCGTLSTYLTCDQLASLRIAHDEGDCDCSACCNDIID